MALSMIWRDVEDRGAHEAVQHMASASAMSVIHRLGDMTEMETVSQ